jgi:hypothetical protein
MARNRDWSYGDSGGADHHTKWARRKRETLHEDAAGAVDRTDDSKVTDYVRCRGSDGVMATVPGRV